MNTFHIIIGDYPSFHSPFTVRIGIRNRNGTIKHIAFVPIGHFKSMNKTREKKLIARQISLITNAYLDSKDVNEVFNKYKSKVRIRPY